MQLLQYLKEVLPLLQLLIVNGRLDTRFCRLLIEHADDRTVRRLDLKHRLCVRVVLVVVVVVSAASECGGGRDSEVV